VEIVDDGTIVQKGQIVVRLDKSQIEAELRSRRLDLANAVAQLKKAEADARLNVNNASTKMTKAGMEQELLMASSRAEIEQAAAKVEYDKAEKEFRERDYSRSERLAQDRLLPITDVERAELRLKSQEHAVRQGESQLEVQQHKRASAATQGDLLLSDAKYSAEAAKNRAEVQVQNARFNVEAKQQLVDLSELQSEWCDVRAPASGLAVIERDWDRGTGTRRALRPGDSIRPSSELMSIIDLASMRVMAEVGEMDATLMEVGQPARVWVRSAPEQILKGRVAAISNLARQIDIGRRGGIPGKKTFRVVVEILDSRTDLLRPGMTADFEVVRGQVEDSVRVPLQALFETSKGTSVFVKRGDYFVTRAVEIRDRNANYAAVATGLKGDEEIALRRPPLDLLEATVAKRQKKPDLIRRTLGVIF
jgi:multidrug resistance efflux pump